MSFRKQWQKTPSSEGRLASCSGVWPSGPRRPFAAIKDRQCALGSARLNNELRSACLAAATGLMAFRELVFRVPRTGCAASRCAPAQFVFSFNFGNSHLQRALPFSVSWHSGSAAAAASQPGRMVELRASNGDSASVWAGPEGEEESLRARVLTPERG